MTTSNNKKIYYEVTIIRSRRATEREGLEYPTVEKTDSIEDNLELAEFNYEHAYIGTETDKELRKITEDENGIVIEDELLKSTY